MDEGILSDREGMQRFAEAVAAEIPVFRIYSNHVDFARRWILGGALPEDVQAPGVYIVLLYRGKGRFFHVGETDEATFGWVRELDDAFLMTGRVIGKADEKDPAAVAKVIMDAFHADPDAGDLLVPEESLFAPGARPEAMVR